MVDTIDSKSMAFRCMEVQVLFRAIIGICLLVQRAHASKGVSPLAENKKEY
jgi:hypothetical protein